METLGLMADFSQITFLQRGSDTFQPRALHKHDSTTAKASARHTRTQYTPLCASQLDQSVKLIA